MAADGQETVPPLRPERLVDAMALNWRIEPGSLVWAAYDGRRPVFFATKDPISGQYRYWRRPRGQDAELLGTAADLAEVNTICEGLLQTSRRKGFEALREVLRRLARERRWTRKDRGGGDA